MKVVIALGGNALDQSEHQGVYENQVLRVKTVARQIVEMIRAGHQVVITHGNGPQVGNLALQQECATSEVPPQPLHVLGAMSQGQIGYLIQRELGNLLRAESVHGSVVSVVTQVVVDKNDGAFLNPTKPIGPFYDRATADRLAKERGYVIKQVKPMGERIFRRVVPSPDPVRIVEAAQLCELVDSGTVVVASGGGGIPVMMDASGSLMGVDAVIDKDLAAERLAEAVKADHLLILTDVDKVKINYGKPGERKLDKMTVSEAKSFMEQGQFPAGSMGPKVLACIRFLEWGGKASAIAGLDEAAEAFKGHAGTQIVVG